MMDKKGVVGRMLSVLTTMVFIIFIMGLFLILAGFAFAVKGPSVPENLIGVVLEPVLLEEIDVPIVEGGEEFESMTIAQALIDIDIKKIRCNEIDKILRGETREALLKGLSTEERDELLEERGECINSLARLKVGIKDALLEENKEKGGTLCFILCSSCVNGKFYSYNILQERSEGNGEDIILKFEDGKFIGNERFTSSRIDTELYSMAGLRNRIVFNVDKDKLKKKYDLVYYKGKCYSDSELQDLIKNRGENE